MKGKLCVWFVVALMGCAANPKAASIQVVPEPEPVVLRIVNSAPEGDAPEEEGVVGEFAIVHESAAPAVVFRHDKVELQSGVSEKLATYGRDLAKTESLLLVLVYESYSGETIDLGRLRVNAIIGMLAKSGVDPERIAWIVTSELSPGGSCFNPIDCADVFRIVEFTAGPES